MEVNKGEAERCREIGSEAYRNGQYSRAFKFLSKSQKLYPLPGVTALLTQTQRKMSEEQGSSESSSSHTNNHDSFTSTTAENGNSNGNSFNNGSHGNVQRNAAAASTATATATAASSSKTNSNTGADGRNYTEAQAKLVKTILKSKEGGRGAHYRVLGVETDADENALKKAYRKLALKLHPDKNSAPQADDAFKALGLAYATLSDKQKRTIYDRYGEEDPDNRAGGMRAGGGQGVHFNGQEVNPEDIFNMFFGGGMPGGAHFNNGGMPGGFRVYSTGFGGVPRQGNQQARQQQRQQQPQNSFMQLVQLLPVLLLFVMSFFNMPGETASGHTGGSNYFSLTHAPPYSNPMKTRLTPVKDIPYYVTNKFLGTYARDRYQLAQVERMVEKSYKNYLESECKNQKNYKLSLQQQARNRKGLTEVDRERQLKKASEFELSRCIELNELFR